LQEVGEGQVLFPDAAVQAAVLDKKLAPVSCAPSSDEELSEIWLGCAMELEAAVTIDLCLLL
jgi:hypothetical protein